MSFIVVGSVATAGGVAILGYWALQDCTGAPLKCRTGVLFGGIGTLVVGVALVSVGVPLFMIGNRWGPPGKAAAGATPEIVLTPGGMGLRGTF
jgi:hypothetical protein